MTDDTFDTKRVAKVYVSGNMNLETTIAGEAGIYPGYAIRIHSDNKAYLCKNSDGAPSGIVEVPRGADADTVIASGDLVEYYPVGQDTEVWAFLLEQSPLSAIRPGTVLVVSGTDGKLMPFSYADSSVATDTLVNKIGRSTIVDTSALADDHLIKLNLAG